MPRKDPTRKNASTITSVKTMSFILDLDMCESRESLREGMVGLCETYSGADWSECQGLDGSGEIGLSDGVSLRGLEILYRGVDFE